MEAPLTRPMAANTKQATPKLRNGYLSHQRPLMTTRMGKVPCELSEGDVAVAGHGCEFQNHFAGKQVHRHFVSDDNIYRTPALLDDHLLALELDPQVLSPGQNCLADVRFRHWGIGSSAGQIF